MTRVNGGSTGGTHVEGGSQGSIFNDLQQAIQATTATHPDPPTDLGTPTTDVLRRVRYSTGEYVAWEYDVSEATWIAREGVPVS